MEQAAPFKSSLYSIVGNKKIFEGKTSAAIVDSTRGIPRFFDLKKMSAGLSGMTANVSSSAFAETYSGSLEASLQVTEQLGELLKATILDTKFTKVDDGDRFTPQLEKVAQLIKMSSALGTERAAFMTALGGFDTHANLHETMASKMKILDKSIQSFVAEMRAQGIWDGVTVMTISDFGRTLTSEHP